MKLAVISDIHGNEQALRAVLDDISKIEVQQVAVLGDISFRGPKPKECLDLVKKLHAKVIKGNGDEWLVRGVKEGEVPDRALKIMQAEQAWAKSKLSIEDIDYLDQLPESLEISLLNKQLLAAWHATPTSLFDIISNEASNKELMPFIQANQHADFYVCGHIHLPYLRSFNNKKFINTGSVGLPFDGDPRASYLVFDQTEQDIQLEFRRVSYDVERACVELDEMNYPDPAKNMIKNVYRKAQKP